MNRHERRAAARKSKMTSSGASVGALATLYETALQHVKESRYGHAQICCKQILERDAGHAGSLQLMGLIALQAKQYDAAIEWIGSANRQDPKSEYLLTLGIALEQQGLHEEALKALVNATRQQPDVPELWTRLADLLVRLQRPDQAIQSFEQALKLNPQYWYAAHNYALLLLRLERFEEALVKLNLCNELQPDHAPTLQSLASALHSLNQFEEALGASRRAQALDPTNADIANNVGMTLLQLARCEEALDQFNYALAVRPNFVSSILNKASALTELQRFDEALNAYRLVKEIDPDNAEADWSTALIQLLHGNLAAGYAGREARWKLPSIPATARYPRFSQPMWRGDRNIAGKTVLVCADEGLGDTIQFVRYVPMLAALGARVILLPQEPLFPLLAELPGVWQCIPNLKGGLPDFDLHCPIMSLPLAFGTTLDTIPASASYLPLPSDARRQFFENRIGPRERLRIGLVWSGNSQHRNDHQRSIPLRALSRITVDGATFVSLQKDLRADDREALRDRSDIVDLTEHLRDFSDTAALAGCLDLVIAVDTSVAHLAAAIGRPTWILLPAVPDWRWLLDRDDSPWYPTVRLFRQGATRDYGDVLDHVRSELQMLICTAPAS